MKVEIRKKVWIKYNKRCAYCGQLIEYKNMQVDHKIPKAHGGSDEYDNLMPSCRICNHYKRALPLGAFRNLWLGDLKKRIEKIYIVKVALQYRMIEIKNFDKIFYFETISQ